MIEIPEAINLSKQINNELKYKKVKRIIADDSHHNFATYYNDPANYPKIFNGGTIQGAYSHDGNLFVKFDGDFGLMFNYGINLRYITNNKLPKRHQLFIEFDDLTHLVCTVNMWGCLLAYKDSNETVPDSQAFLFTDQFTMDWFLNSLHSVDNHMNSVKSYLTTDSRIPGFGNGVLHDILFNAQIKPKRRLETLKDSEKEKLYLEIKRTLLDMTEKGGRDTEKDIYGNHCGYKTRLSRNTYELPCPRCGGVIKKESYLGGSVYYCMDCQV